MNCLLLEFTDAARFGSNYLSKFGWDPSKGLGVGEEGRTSHIKVAQKLDMMGIGAAHQADPDGVAWKQNKDFENLLKRLNQANGDVDVKEGSSRIVTNGFVQQKGKLEEEEEEGEEGKVKDRKEDSRKEKRKKNDEQARAKDKGKQKDKDATEKKKKRKRDGNDTDKKSKKKRKSDNDNTSEDNKQDESSPTPPEPTPPIEQKATRVVPRHRSCVSSHFCVFIPTFAQASGTSYCCQSSLIKICGCNL